MKKYLLSYILPLVALFNVSLVLSSCGKDDYPEQENSVLTIKASEEEIFMYGATQDFELVQAYLDEIKVTAPKGWKATVENEGKTLSVVAPEATATDFEKSGNIRLVAESPLGVSFKRAYEFKVAISSTYTLSFEDVDAKYLAGPTSYGENLYVEYTGTNPEIYKGYLDKTTGLFFNMTTDGYGFASGGIAFSQWNDMTTAGYTNQCSVFFGDNNKKNGGYNNSSTFTVGYASFYGEEIASFMKFEDNAEKVFESAYFTNNTYAVLSMETGDQFAKKFSHEDKDWFKLIIIGYDKDGKETKTIEHYMADFRTADAKGISKTWEKVDLTELGKVNKVVFKMDSSDSGQWGMNTPAYFCMDEITINLD